MSAPPLVIPCQCGRLATLYEGMQDEKNHLLKLICACGIEGASLTYQKPRDRERTIWAACDGWRLSNGVNSAQ
jgi:hypothetical protein